MNLSQVCSMIPKKMTGGKACRKASERKVYTSCTKPHRVTKKNRSFCNMKSKLSWSHRWWCRNQNAKQELQKSELYTMRGYMMMMMEPETKRLPCSESNLGPSRHEADVHPTASSSNVFFVFVFCSSSFIYNYRYIDTSSDSRGFTGQRDIVLRVQNIRAFWNESSQESACFARKA